MSATTSTKHVPTSPKAEAVQTQDGGGLAAMSEKIGTSVDEKIGLQKIKIPGKQYDVLATLIDLGALISKVPTSEFSGENLRLLNLMKSDTDLLEVDEKKQGRGSTVTAVKVLRPLEDFEPVRRAAKGTSGGGATRKRRGSHQSDLSGLNSGDRIGGGILIKDEDLENLRENLRAYLNETTLKANQLWHQGRQEYIEDQKRQAMSLTGDAFFDRMSELAEERKQSFDQYLEKKFGKVMLALFPVKDQAVDTPDPKPESSGGRSKRA